MDNDRFHVIAYQSWPFGTKRPERHWSGLKEDWAEAKSLDEWTDIVTKMFDDHPEQRWYVNPVLIRQS